MLGGGCQAPRSARGARRRHGAFAGDGRSAGRARARHGRAAGREDAPRLAARPVHGLRHVRPAHVRGGGARDAPPDGALQEDGAGVPPERAFAGRGIVIVGGNQRNSKLRTGSRSMRCVAPCALPIQLWFPEREGPDCERADELRRMGVTIHSFADLVDADAAGGAHGAAAMTNRFMYKIVALVFSSFQEVLLMDSDNIVLSDPSSLFASELCTDLAGLWMDFWRGSAAPPPRLRFGRRRGREPARERADGDGQKAHVGGVAFGALLQRARRRVLPPDRELHGSGGQRDREHGVSASAYAVRRGAARPGSRGRARSRSRRDPGEHHDAARHGRDADVPARQPR